MSLSYLVRGYPRNHSDDTGVRNTYLYRGPTATLKSRASTYRVNKTFADGMPVSVVDLEPMENPSFSELTIETFLPRGQNSIPSGSGNESGNLLPPDVTPDAPLTNNESVERTVGEPRRGGAGVTDEYPFYEVDETQIEKNLFQHPDFIGFTPTQFAGCRAWDEETDTSAKADFKYWNRDKNNEPTGTIQSLDSDQIKYAKLRLLGVESFLDFAPLARKTSKYFGNTMPNVEDAGQKADSDPFDAVPEGYEWLKIADRASKQGEGSDWIRVEEWQGARKVLIDKDEIFLD